MASTIDGWGMADPDPLDRPAFHQAPVSTDSAIGSGLARVW